MYANVESIGPDQAQQILECNKNNRYVTEHVSDKYADEMDRGAWLENGASIVIGSNGNLLDGQNRLKAIVKSGVTIPMVVVRDVNPKAQATMDTGILRRLKDVLTIDGAKDGTNLAGALMTHAAYKHCGRFKFPTRERPNFSEMKEYAKRHPEIEKSVDFINSFDQKPLIPRGTLAGLHALFAEKDVMAANQFIESFVTGANLTMGHPVQKLRERLIDDERKLMTSGRLTGQERAVVAVIAWNAVRNDTTVQKFYIGKKGKKGIRSVEIV